MNSIESRHPGDQQCSLRTIRCIQLLLLHLPVYVEPRVGCVGYRCVQKSGKRQLSALSVENGHLAIFSQVALMKQHGSTQDTSNV